MTKGVFTYCWNCRVLEHGRYCISGFPQTPCMHVDKAHYQPCLLTLVQEVHVFEEARACCDCRLVGYDYDWQGDGPLGWHNMGTWRGFVAFTAR